MYTIFDVFRFLCVCVCVGDRYVVVDCGGGTVDLTVHQIRLPEGHLKELYKASGTCSHYTESDHSQSTASTWNH